MRSRIIILSIIGALLAFAGCAPDELLIPGLDLDEAEQDEQDGEPDGESGCSLDPDDEFDCDADHGDDDSADENADRGLDSDWGPENGSDSGLEPRPCDHGERACGHENSAGTLGVIECVDGEWELVVDCGPYLSCVQTSDIVRCA
jgi:hypothetical protein